MTVNRPPAQPSSWAAATRSGGQVPSAESPRVGPGPCNALIPAHRAGCQPPFHRPTLCGPARGGWYDLGEQGAAPQSLAERPAVAGGRRSPAPRAVPERTGATDWRARTAGVRPVRASRRACRRPRSSRTASPCRGSPSAPPAYSPPPRRVEHLQGRRVTERRQGQRRPLQPRGVVQRQRRRPLVR